MDVALYKVFLKKKKERFIYLSTNREYLFGRREKIQKKRFLLSFVFLKQTILRFSML